MGSFCQSNKLSIATVAALALGIGGGVVMRSWSWSEDTLGLIALPGDIYTRMLKMLVLPLIFPKLILAVTALDGKLSGKLGALLIVSYFLQNVVNAFLSIMAAFVIQPGVGYSHLNDIATNLSYSPSTMANDTSFPVSLIIIDLFKNMFPENIVKTMIFQTKSVIAESDTQDKEIQETNVDATNNLGMVIVSITLGFALRGTPKTSTGVISFFEGLASAFTKIIEWVVNFGPIGILSLVWYQTLKIEDISLTLSQMGLYILTILIVLLIHAWVFMPLVFLLITRHNPYRYMYNIMEVLPTVITTSSSLAALPITSRCLEEKNKINPKVVSFALPIGTTINMLPIAMVSILFLMQLEGITPSTSNLFVMCLTLTFVAVGAAGIPQDNLILVFMAVSILGFSTKNIVKVISIEWFIDRFSCVSKIMVDGLIVGIVHHFTEEDPEAVEEPVKHVETDPFI
eukprot:GFUD01034450.1.p1 GENE.GFUD01034450.1~~GFUD01034450.1.p1  ORF type:complete len:457 (+),score=74.11 GFUD01034450.1:121-1491(+)